MDQREGCNHRRKGIGGGTVIESKGGKDVWGEVQVVIPY